MKLYFSTKILPSCHRMVILLPPNAAIGNVLSVKLIVHTSSTFGLKYMFWLLETVVFGTNNTLSCDMRFPTIWSVRLYHLLPCYPLGANNVKHICVYYP